MGKYIDPTYDLGFKLLFDRENLSNVLLIGLLNALLEGEPELRGINSIKYLNSEKPAGRMSVTISLTSGFITSRIWDLIRKWLS